MTELTLSTESTLMDLASRYSSAWAHHDPNAILALHSEDSVFEVHGGGLKATGLTEIRKALDTFFATWTQARFEPRGVLFGNGHFVAEWTLHATIVSLAGVEGTQNTTATSQDIAIEGVDIIRVLNGRVTRKDTYVDALTLQAQLGSTPVPAFG
jgi:steroid delta-isomerase-like uncharacterized protein